MSSMVDINKLNGKYVKIITQRLFIIVKIYRKMATQDHSRSCIGRVSYVTLNYQVTIFSLIFISFR